MLLEELEKAQSFKGQGFDCFAVVLRQEYRFSLVGVSMVYVVMSFMSICFETENKFLISSWAKT